VCELQEVPRPLLRSLLVVETEMLNKVGFTTEVSPTAPKRALPNMSTAVCMVDMNKPGLSSYI
jgi:hypothetical protein